MFNAESKFKAFISLVGIWIPKLFDILSTRKTTSIESNTLVSR